MLPLGDENTPAPRGFPIVNISLIVINVLAFLLQQAFGADASVMAYGTMGGEGQPQTQAAIFSRYARFGVPLQEAITRPRWLLGRTWGEESTSLKLEDRFDPTLIEALAAAGHVVERLPAFSPAMGHAGAIIRHQSGLLEGATDPRSDGMVATW